MILSKYEQYSLSSLSIPPPPLPILDIQSPRTGAQIRGISQGLWRKYSPAAGMTLLAGHRGWQAVWVAELADEFLNSSWFFAALDKVPLRTPRNFSMFGDLSSDTRTHFFIRARTPRRNGCGITVSLRSGRKPEGPSTLELRASCMPPSCGRAIAHFGAAAVPY
jgi:hypothetical protein